MRKDLDGSGQEWVMVDGLQLPAGNDSSFLAGQPASCPATRGGCKYQHYRHHHQQTNRTGGEAVSFVLLLLPLPYSCLTYETTLASDSSSC